MADTIIPQEIWKEIPHLGHEASSLGRIRRIKTGRILALMTNKLKYQTVNVQRPDGWSKSFFVHMLVALAFHGPRPIKHDIDHLDRNPSNNRPENLEYVTHRENCRRGVRPRGTTHHNARLTEYEVCKLRRLVAENDEVSVCELMKQFNVERKTLYNALHGRNWNHVNIPPVTKDLRNGVSMRGRDAILSDDDVRDIRQLNAAGVSPKDLMKLFPISRRYLFDVRRGKVRKYVTDAAPSSQFQNTRIVESE